MLARMPQGFVARFDATRFDRSRSVFGPVDIRYLVSMIASIFGHFDNRLDH
jgi:hypothetical protein